MKHTIEITEEALTDVIAKHLRESYKTLKQLYAERPNLYSKKDLKALKRAANYYSTPRDFVK